MLNSRPAGEVFATRYADVKLYSRVIREIDMQKLADIMSRDVTVISPDASIHQAAQKMRSGDFGLLPWGKMTA